MTASTTHTPDTTPHAATHYRSLASEISTTFAASTASTASASPPESGLQVLRCKNTADFIAALPRLLGFTPKNSLVIVFFSGNRSGSTLRVDLPHSQSPSDTSKFLNELCSLLRRLRAQHGPGSPAVVISCEQTFEESRGTPWRKFARSLERCLSRDGDRVRELCCIAPDAWASYLDSNTPLLGHPLEEITQSSMVEGTVSLGIDDIGSFAPASQPECARVLRAISKRTNLFGHPVVTDGGGPDLIAAALVGIAELDTAAIAETIVTTNTEAGWVAIFEQIVATAEGFLSPRGLREPESAQRESAHRLRLAADRLARSASLAPEHLQPPVMAASAIAWWLRGLQSVAHRQIDEAFKLDPGCEPVRVVRRFIQSERYSPIPSFA